MYEHDSIGGAPYEAVTVIYERTRRGHADPTSDQAHEAGYLAALAEKREAKDVEGIAASWFCLARFWDHLKRRGHACSAHLALLDAEQSHFGYVDREVAGTWQNFGAFLGELGHAAVAECCMRIATRIHMNAEGIGVDYESTEQLLMMLWSAHQYERMFVHAKAMEGCDEPHLLGSVRRCLGHAYEAAGRHADAIASYAIAATHLAPEHEDFPDVAIGHADAVFGAEAPADLPPALVATLKRTLNSPALDRAWRHRILTLLADAGDLDAVLEGLDDTFSVTRRRLVALLRRGATRSELLEALTVAARKRNTPRAWSHVARFALEGEVDARAALDQALDDDILNVYARALVALDDGDLKTLRRLSQRGDRVVDVIEKTALFEAEPSAEIARDVYGAVRRWADEWREILDENGRAVVSRS